VLKLNTSQLEYDDSGVVWEIRTKAYDFGLPFVDKKARALLLEVDNVFSDITADFVIDYDRLDTRDSGETSPVVAANTAGQVYGTGVGDTPNVYGTAVYGGPDRGFMLSRKDIDTRIWGKRHQLVLSGTSLQASPVLNAITLFVEPQPGVRFAEA